MFDIHPTRSYGFTNSKLFKTDGKTPVVVNSSQDNGIGGYVNLIPTEKGNKITFSDTTTANSIFYQKDDFIGYSHIQGMYPKTDIKWTKDALLYFVAVFRKATENRFDYANKFNRKLAVEFKVDLPINKNEQPDFDFMEQFVKIQQKIVIKSVMEREI